MGVSNDSLMPEKGGLLVSPQTGLDQQAVVASSKPRDTMTLLDDLNPYWIWLAELKGVAVPEKLRLLDYFRTPENLYAADGHDIPSFFLRATNDLAAKLTSQKSLDSAMRILEKSHRLGIRMMVASDPFLVIYVLGELVAGPSAAVVGTRKATGDGYRGAEAVCRELIAAEVCINSGMAHGVDSFAHQYALAEGGKSQGFAAHGLDMCYPSEHYNLMRRLTEEGAVISPFPVGTQPFRANFLKRNALMSLWSDEVILVEAGLRSGAMDTAHHGLRQGRPLWAVMGRAGSEQCAGNQWLLETGRAKPFSLRGGLSQVQAQAQKPTNDLGEARDLGHFKDHDDNQKLILETLREVPMSIEALMARLGGPELLWLESALLELERTRMVVYLPDGRWRYCGW
jgi:DNA processing protein